MAVPLQSAGNDSLCLVEVAKVTQLPREKDGDEVRDHMCEEHLGRCLWQKKVVWKEKIINLKREENEGVSLAKTKEKSHLVPFFSGAD